MDFQEILHRQRKSIQTFMKINPENMVFPYGIEPNVELGRYYTLDSAYYDTVLAQYIVKLKELPEDMFFLGNLMTMPHINLN